MIYKTESENDMEIAADEELLLFQLLTLKTNKIFRLSILFL